MAKRKIGLHKKIAAIFEGVPIPKDNGGQDSSEAPTPPRLLSPAPASPDARRGGGQTSVGANVGAQKDTSHILTRATAWCHLTRSAPKPQQSEQPPPEAGPAKRPKADVIIKIFGRIPALTKLSRMSWLESWQRIKSKLFAPEGAVSTTTTRQKVMTVLVPVLFIVLIFVFVKVFSTSSPPAESVGTEPVSVGPVGAEPVSAKPAGTVVASGSKIDWQRPEPYPVTLRDPMQFGSAATAQGRPSRLIVTGIVYSEDKPSAIVNNQIVYEGDKVSDITVVKISQDSVEFEMDGKSWTQKVKR